LSSPHSMRVTQKSHHHIHPYHLSHNSPTAVHCVNVLDCGYHGRRRLRGCECDERARAGNKSIMLVQGMKPSKFASATAKNNYTRTTLTFDTRLLRFFPQAFSIVAQVVGAAVFGFVVGNISSVIADLDKTGEPIVECMPQPVLPHLLGFVSRGHSTPYVRG
jgi:hypothetical protein